MRFQPNSGVTDTATVQAFDQVSRVLDSTARVPAFGALTAAVVQVSEGEFKRLAPRAAGQTVVLPEAAALNAGLSVFLLVNGLGTLTIKPVSGTVNGAASALFAAGAYAVELTSDGDGRWLTRTVPDGSISTAKLAALSVTTAKIDNLAVTTGKLAADAVTAAKLADSSVEPANLIASITFGVPFIVTQPLTGGVTGTADDVTIYNADAPFDMRILDVWAVLSAGVLASTVQLRSASGGGGSALSSAIPSTTSGTSRNNDTATRQVAGSGSLFIRRSDRAVAGRILILAVRE
jgi:hypothetical protein